MENQVSDKGFFYVYDNGLRKFLRFDKNIEWNCSGLNVKTKDQFWQFTKSEYLFECINEYIIAKKTITPTNIHVSE
ncbi:hypothetical protein [Paenibacillus sp. FSL M7-0420]|uniref:hypothetical protein n=1 Tax=Paenibacillus sp. FSL M7-0420 TaxID=2921609 RepID=UPI0030FA3B80